MSRVYFAIFLAVVYALMWATKHAFHECMGVVVLITLLAHVFNNRRWFTSLFKGKYTTKRRLMLISNVLLVIFFVCTFVTGVMYSKVLFPWLDIHQAARSFKKIHSFFAYGTLVFIATHTLLHLQIVVNYVKKILQKLNLAS